MVQLVEARAHSLGAALDLLHLFGHQLLQGGKQSFTVQCAVIRSGFFGGSLLGNGLFHEGCLFDGFLLDFGLFSHGLGVGVGGCDVGRSLNGGLHDGSLLGFGVQRFALGRLQGGGLFHLEMVFCC